MKNLYCKCFALTYGLLWAMALHAQAPATEKADFGSYHKLTLAMGQAHITDALNEEGKKVWSVFGAWGLDYDYGFNKHWALGIHNDMILETVQVEKDSEVKERSFPFASSLVASFKPGEHFSFQLGAGGEFAKEGNLFLTKLGVEYGYEIKNGWEISAAINYDIKWSTYNSWFLMVGLSKSLFRKK